ncbi:unnamed protein product [Didymodactylos carnosus]|uniref:Uncharacterized protein n=1 Tax=Didymodactylos carnosus TaxID=1234261 RepID=A0A814T9Y6_9BILA|nr:unnamed protein product [Didymodactylos carnosus]CAF1158585.1 unnamed protein product [Didymodactylos carnosus]CAF3596248.1 unnamed protein product [Didymodactylos carnosus]CAF3922012.1 unnamed protein product [Didymodactylos carnosus]
MATAASNNTTVCQIVYVAPHAEEAMTTILAILNRYNFGIKPVSIRDGMILYMCIKRDPAPADVAQLTREMQAALARSKAGIGGQKFIQWTFA